MKRIFPPTSKRVALNTNPTTNKSIRNNTLRRINIFKNCSDKILSDNVDNLNHEWDVERALEISAASVILGSTIMGLKTKKKYWLMISGTASLFLMQHSLQGWCPPVSLVRRLGIRTSEEINNEKIVYKLLKNDFENIPSTAEELLDVAEK